MHSSILCLNLNHMGFLFLNVSSLSRICFKYGLHVPWFPCVVYIVTNMLHALFPLFYDSLFEPALFLCPFKPIKQLNYRSCFNRIWKIYVMVMESRCLDARQMSYNQFSELVAFYLSVEILVLVLVFFVLLIYYLHYSKFWAESYSCFCEHCEIYLFAAFNFTVTWLHQ